MTDHKTAPYKRCRRCKGVGHTDVDILPGLPHEPCHRCGGRKVEPFWAASPAALEMAFRREATRAGVELGFQDFVVDAVLRRDVR